MRFTLLFPVALLAGFAAAAGPIRDSEDVSVSATGGSGTPEFDPVDTPSGGPNPNAESDPEVVGGDGETSGVSKRDEFNPLDERGFPSNAPTLILCPTNNCHGRCWGYNLNQIRFNKCYPARTYHSVYVQSRRGLGYGVYVANEHRRKCRGTLVPHVRTCYKVRPSADAFFKLH